MLNPQELHQKSSELLKIIQSALEHRDVEAAVLCVACLRIMLQSLRVAGVKEEDLMRMADLINYLLEKASR